MKEIKRTLTFAGCDVTGGAGMAADLKTFEEYGTYGQVALTTIVTMDKDNNWAHEVVDIDVELLKKEISTIFYSQKEIAAMKTGMLGSPETVRLVSDTIEKYGIKNVVIDPVLVCKGTDEVLNPDTADSIRSLLLPKSDVFTPNLFEAGVMAEMGNLESLDQVKEAAKKIVDMGAKTVVIKGGKALESEEAIDCFYDGKDFEILRAKKIKSGANHGAGCSFSAAVTAGLAQGLSEKESVILAKKYVNSAIKNGFTYNQYIGPVYLPAYRLERQEGIEDL